MTVLHPVLSPENGVQSMSSFRVDIGKHIFKFTSYRRREPYAGFGTLGARVFLKMNSNLKKQCIFLNEDSLAERQLNMV